MTAPIRSNTTGTTTAVIGTSCESSTDISDILDELDELDVADVETV